jgi:LacI family repressor for deo operon, udp, cdd, tsx, nupC, and nupG
VIVAAKKLGLKVPEDVSVVGFDNIELSNMTEPPITTIEQPAHQLGYQAAELLLEKIRKPDMADRQIILDTHLVVRGSTTLSSM